MPIQYRAATIHDLKHILPLAEGFARETTQQLPINRLVDNFMDFSKSGLAQTIEHPFGVIMVAEQVEEGARPRILGYCAATGQEPPPVFDPIPYVFVTELFVAPEHRRQGIGTALIERVRGWGLLKGINRMSMVIPAQGPAQGLYAKLGYRPLQQLLFFEEQE